MSLVKDFETKIEGRDKVLDDNDAYRRKMWLENLDLINNNLSKFLEVMTELEKNMNTLGMRQNELNRKVDLTNESVQEDQTGKESAKRKKKMEVKFQNSAQHWIPLIWIPQTSTLVNRKEKNRPIHSVVNPSLLPILLFSTVATKS